MPSWLDEAAEMLGRGSLDVIVYASTTSGYALGFEADTALASRLSQRGGVFRFDGDLIARMDVEER